MATNHDLESLDEKSGKERDDASEMLGYDAEYETYSAADKRRIYGYSILSAIAAFCIGSIGSALIKAGGLRGLLVCVALVASGFFYGKLLAMCDP